MKQRALGLIRHTPERRVTWKDPRMTLLLPFWKPLLPSTRYILCLRNPLNVAASLARRDAMSREQALSLWMLYTVRGLLDTFLDHPLLIFYEDLVGPDSASQLERLAQFLGVPTGGELPRGVIRTEYSHGEQGSSDIFADASVPLSVRQLWAALVNWRSSQSEWDLEVVRNIAAAFTLPVTPWTTAEKYRVNFWARQIKMQLLEEWDR